MIHLSFNSVGTVVVFVVVVLVVADDNGILAVRSAKQILFAEKITTDNRINVVQLIPFRLMLIQFGFGMGTFYRLYYDLLCDVNYLLNLVSDAT